MALLSYRGRSRGRRLTPMELAIAVALGGSLLAIVVPSFVRELHASRFVEPIEGLQRIAASAMVYAQAHPVAQAFPPSVAMTPAAPPRGRCEVDPADLWDRPTWHALDDFRPVDPGEPHCFSFGFDSALNPARSTFRAYAHGDLDGDGITSTFEMTGHALQNASAARVAEVDPGMFVDSEVE